MNVHRAPVLDEPQGQATFDMANLRPQRTGLPFIVFISQKAGAKHDVRVKVAPDPKMRADQVGSYALRPFKHVEGPRMTSHEEQLLQAWAEENLTVLVDYWEGRIEYTEDAMDRLKKS